jgi:hypothetical protein
MPIHFILLDHPNKIWQGSFLPQEESSEGTSTATLHNVGNCLSVNMAHHPGSPESPAKPLWEPRLWWLLHDYQLNILAPLKGTLVCPTQMNWQVLTLVSVCMISTAHVYTATFAWNFLVTSPSTWRLKTIPCNTSELCTPEPCQTK